LHIEQKGRRIEFEILGKRLNEIYVKTIEQAQRAQSKFRFTTNGSENKCSLDNLLCYLALREHDLSDLQLRLDDEGLSSLGMLEGLVLVSIEKVLEHFGISPLDSGSLCKIDSRSAGLLLKKRSNLIFGSPDKGRRTYIMVTLDSSDIYQHELIEQLLENGMDIARINCAHNTDREWRLIIKAIREAEKRLREKESNRKCMILMDLAGPKIRTGPMELKVRPLKISVPKAPRGSSVHFLEGFLDTEASYTELVDQTVGRSSFVIAVSTDNDGGLWGLEIGQRITFNDARDERPHTMTVLERLSPMRVRIGLEQTAYLNDGIKLETDSNGNNKCSFTIRSIKPQPIDITVQSGDVLRLYRDTRLGHNASDGSPAAVSCTYPEVIDQVKVGHRIFIDDGKIEAIVRSSNEQYLELDVISPKGLITKIKSNKGINFPDSRLKMPTLTADDIRNLDFVVKHADMVGLSFVHRPEDIYDLRQILSKLGHPSLGIVAKIETSDSIHNLARILIAGLELSKFAILIARGDLAVEVGFENLAFIQEDILCLCEGAHIPVILATQILESLAESGLRTRPEITDAIMGQRAECVMLNNGKHILEAVKTLAILLRTEERHQIKKHQLFSEYAIHHTLFDNTIDS
jgi:pyruvate kinase